MLIYRMPFYHYLAFYSTIILFYHVKHPYRSQYPFYRDRTNLETAYTYHTLFLKIPVRSGFKAGKCPRTLALNLARSVPSKSGITSAVESTYPGDQTLIFGPHGGLEGGSEGSGRVGHQSKQAPQDRINAYPPTRIP